MPKEFGDDVDAEDDLFSEEEVDNIDRDLKEPETDEDEEF